MSDEKLHPDVASLFQKYRADHRDVFLEHMIRFVEGYGCTRAELDTLRSAIRKRRQSLERGWPRGGERKPSQARIESEYDAVIDPHSSFRGIAIVCGDSRHRRPLFLDEALLFIQNADWVELTQIRGAIAQRGRAGWHDRRGRPGAFKEESINGCALRAVWMRYIEGKTQREVSSAVGMPDNSPDAKGTSVRRLEDYFAAMIYDSVPYEYLEKTEAGLGQYEIKPGALDDKHLQARICFNTKLPFLTHPDECKRIVTALWPRAFPAYWKQLHQSIARKRTKASHLNEDKKPHFSE